MLAATPAHAQLMYKVVPSSAIRISGTSTISDWVVKSQNISGEMVFTPSGEKATGHPRGGGAIKDARLVLEVSTIKSEKGEAMDNKMYQALNKDEHPQITFVLTRPLQLPGTTGKLAAYGDVTLAGVTRAMTFDLDISGEADSFRFKGSKPVKLSDFGIDPPSAMFGQIVTGDDIVVELDLLFGR